MGCTLFHWLPVLFGTYLNHWDTQWHRFPEVTREIWCLAWAAEKGVHKRGCSSLILRLFAFVCVRLRLRAFTCVLGPFSERLKSALVCVCGRLRAFVCACKHPLLLHPLLRHPDWFQLGSFLWIFLRGFFQAIVLGKTSRKESTEKSTILKGTFWGKFLPWEIPLEGPTRKTLTR